MRTGWIFPRQKVFHAQTNFLFLPFPPVFFSHVPSQGVSALVHGRGHGRDGIHRGRVQHERPRVGVSAVPRGHCGTRTNHLESHFHSNFPLKSKMADGISIPSVFSSDFCPFCGTLEKKNFDKKKIFFSTKKFFWKKIFFDKKKKDLKEKNRFFLIFLCCF